VASRHGVDEAIVISQFDFPATEEILVHNCEDCACAVSDDRSLITLPPPGAFTGLGKWICGPEVCDLPIGAGNRLLFNPLGHGGVVVVNERAHQIFRAFAQPVTVPGVVTGHRGFGTDVSVSAVVARLAQLQLIHPAADVLVPKFGPASALTAWLHVSNACNLRCPYCYIDKTNDGMDEATGRAAVEAVIRSAVEHGFPGVRLKYAGGEASLNHRMVIYLHRLARNLAAERELDLQGVLLSNGVALSSGLVSTLKSEGIRVMISLDGVGDQHDAQRPFVSGRPSFSYVERTIAQLIGQSHAPHLSITLTRRNAGGLADVIRFALERDLTFSINFFRDNDCAASFSDLRYEEQAMIVALLDGFSVIEEFMPRWSVLGSILDRGQLVQPRQRSCGVGHDYVVIDQAGQVAKCHMEIEKTLGDVFRDDPLQLVRNDMSSALNLAVDEKEGCRGCTWRYWCSGGCTLATFRATGRYDIKSPNCGIYKAIYPQALRLEGLRLLKYGGSGSPTVGSAAPLPSSS
jgi:uncharacterized protein